jgi:endonuclease/exonuclease/phosphatase family metal-dependent hydrolase
METKQTLRIATWNLDHAKNSSRPIDLQRAIILQKKPDIIVLTETCEAVNLTDDGYHVVYPDKKNEYGKYDSAIWSKYPLFKSFKTTDEELSVCALTTSTPLGDVMVYATIIPYHGYKGKDKQSGGWVEHYKAIKRIDNDLTRLQMEFSKSIPLFVAGDFNQTRDGSKGTYGTAEGRQMLSETLERNNLTCLTEINYKLKPDPKNGWPRNNVDHICMTRGAFSVVASEAWNHFTEDGIYLSDHNGVYVDLQTK